jgi:hypothetical protein
LVLLAGNSIIGENDLIKMSQVKEAKKLFFKALDADEKNQAAAFDLYLGMGLSLL